MFPSYASYDVPYPASFMMIYPYGNNVRLYLETKFLTEGTVKAFTNWLVEHNPYMIRVFATPTESAIDLPEIPKTQAKTMIYEVGTTIEPSNMYGKYVKKY